MNTTAAKLEGWEVAGGQARLPEVEGFHQVWAAFPADSDPWPRLARSSPRLICRGQVGKVIDLDAVVDIGSGWAMRLTFEPPGVVVGVELAPVGDPCEAPTFGTNLVRRMGFGGALDAVVAIATDVVVATRFLGPDWEGPPSRPGRKGTDERVYARWALWYVRALEVDPSSPVPVIIRDHPSPDGGPYTTSQVYGMVNRARTRAGMLTAAAPGKAGGELTPKARRLLREMGEL